MMERPDFKICPSFSMVNTLVRLNATVIGSVPQPKQISGMFVFSNLAHAQLGTIHECRTLTS